MQRVGEQPSEHLVEEWNSLSVIYNSAVDSRRAAWCVITSIEQKEKSKGEEQLASYAREYVAKVEGELQKIREGVLALMDKNLIQLANTDESKVLYHKMKGEYHRYLAESATCDAMGKAAGSVCVAYVEANKITETDMVVNHPVRLATFFQSEVFQNSDEASEMARIAFEDAITAPAIDIPAVTQQTPIAQIVQTTIEIPQLHCISNVIDIPVVEVVQVPQAHVAEKTVEIPQLDVVEKIVETPEIQTGHGTQDRVQQSSMVQTIENLAISLAEKIVEMPVARTQEKTQHVVNTHVQHVVNAVEAEMPKIIKETVQTKKPIINDKIKQVTKHVEIPQVQIVENTAETSKIQTIQGTRTSESLGTAPVCQVTQARHVEVKSRARSRDYDTGRTAGIYEDMSADRPKPR